MTEHDVLCAAKSYLLNHGWMQGSYGFDPCGPRCLVGACMECAPHGTAAIKAEQALAKVEEMPYGVPLWNDKTERTFDDVIAAIDKAILATAPAETPDPSPSVPVEAFA